MQEDKIRLFKPGDLIYDGFRYNGRNRLCLGIYLKYDEETRRNIFYSFTHVTLINKVMWYSMDDRTFSIHFYHE